MTTPMKEGTKPEFPKAGERSTGEFHSDLPALEGWSWPYVAISGVKDGPQTTILAGVHGCEYTSMYAAIRLGRELDPAEVTGRVLVVPVVNLPAFWSRTPFVVPVDGLNPNRVFPGKLDGSFTEVLAYHIFTTCIAPSQAMLDLHGGDLVEELLPFAGYALDVDPAISEQSRALAAAFGLPFTIGHHDTTPDVPGLTHLAAAHGGVPSALAEAGGIGQLTLEDVQLLVAGARRALGVAGNLAPDPISGSTRISQRSETLRSPIDGFWLSFVKAGDEVAEGEQLGQLLDLYGEVKETITAPFGGTVVYRTTSAAVKAEGILLNLSD